MKLYSENKDYKLYEGSMLDMLKVIEPESIDSVVTDPPYELNFMGKGWDNSGIAFQPDTWKKCYEVLKPGGYLLAFGGSRTFHRIACAIEDAGFEIRDTIMWLYGSGFPKSMDISKSLDKRNGRNLEIYKEIGRHIKAKREKKNISIKEMNEIFGYVAGCNWWESQNDNNVRLPNLKDWNRLKEIINVDSKYDEVIKREEAKREVIGKRKVMGKDTIDIYGKYKGGEIDITLPSTDIAKQWQGWGTALKPSFEPIIVARKPFKGSLVDNVIENGVGGINIDECRVEPTGEDIGRNNTGAKNSPLNSKDGWNNNSMIGLDTTGRYEGRFPANTILTYDETNFDEVCGGFPNTKSGVAVRHNSGGNTFGGNNKKPPMEDLGYNDSGSASRYFYCAKASAKDRNEGLDVETEEYVLKENTPKEIEQLILDSLTS